MEKVIHILCMVSVFRTIFTQSNDDCFTPNNLNGVCINLLRCPELRKMSETQRKNSTAVNYLKESACGYEGRNPKVCCPLENESPSTRPTTGSWNNNNNNNNNNNHNNNNNNNNNNYNTVSSNKLPSQNSCGRTNTSHNRIVGGSPSDLGAWPWMTALGYRDLNRPNRDLQWLCGGALISDRYVVTAAHCTVGIGNRKLAVARLGDLNLDNNVNDGAAPVDAPVTRVLTHERYNAQEYTNDIALLKLENSVGFTKFIQPICLPVLSNHRNNLLVGYNPFVAGWGSISFRGPATTTLMEVQVPVLDNDGCKRAFANKKTVIDNRVLCAGYLTGGKDACQGDSGGPLMWPSGNQYYLVGVVSFGFKCAEPGYPGVYTRVTSFVDWIAETMDNS
uniref:CLIP domain-containing serine protease n=1 Tax=Nipponaphis monzeni TaxID=196483 RepID=A0A481MQI0_9HEMI